MAEHEKPIDIEEIKRNASADGIPLGEIAIIYKNLTEPEKSEMRNRGLIARESDSVVIGKFTPSGDALFKEKAYGVLSLSA
jgi:hypothetical protein